MARLKLGIAYYDLCLILLVIICASLVFSSFKYLVFASGADEGYYLQYALFINDFGFTAFPKMFDNYITDSQSWIYPNPLRLGFIFISALWIRVFGATYLALSSLSLFFYLLAIAVSYYFSKKYFDETIALLLSVLAAFSPLNMAMAKRALADSAANFFLVLSLWLFFDVMNDRKRFKHFAFVITYSMSILIKETSVLLVPIFVIYAMIRKYGFKKEAQTNDILSASLYPLLVAGAVYLLASGSPRRILDIARIILMSPSTNTYAMLCSSGPWFRYFVDFVLLSPLTFLLAAGFFFNRLLSSKNEEAVLYFIVVFISYLCLMNIFAKNIRYVMLLDLPIRLFSVLMIIGLTKKVFKRYWRLLAYIFVLLIASYDYFSFYNLFVIYGIYDPVSIRMLEAWKFIPIYR